MVKTEDVLRCQNVINSGDVAGKNSCILRPAWDKGLGICAEATTKNECKERTPAVQSIDNDLKCDWSSYRFNRNDKPGDYSVLSLPIGETILSTAKKIFTTKESFCTLKTVPNHQGVVLMSEK